MPSVLAEVGSTANEYQILAKLAMGGMAEIFLARGASSAGLARYVVLKRIIRERAHETHLVQMFLEEARLAAQLQHTNIAQVYDIGKLGESYFFTMEYVHGETVRGLLHRARSLRRELPLNVVLTVIAGAAAGLHHAHERIGMDGRPLGIVHRDVSPSNLMVSYEGGVKVVDFGVAKADNRAHETREGAVKGKIAYLSPEQCRGNPLDRRSDLFGLGIVMWEMLTTERLFKRESDFANMTAIVNEPAPSPAQHRPGLPWDIEQLTLRLLSKYPEQRPQTAGELVEAIEELAAKNGLVLSATALGKFMKELFGQRPEPWVEIETRDVPEGVTVTSEPIPPELAPDPIDEQLRAVRDLSRQYAAQLGSQSESMPPQRPIEQPRPMGPDALATMPVYRPPVTAPVTAPVPARTGSSRAKVIAVAALLATAAGIAALVVATRGDEVPAPKPPGGSAVAAVTPPDAQVIDAQVVDAPDLDAGEIDAAQIDAALAATITPDAAVAAAAEPAEIARVAFNTGNYAAALAACAGQQPSGAFAMVCTSAACSQKDSARAKLYVRGVPRASRAQIDDDCLRSGIDVRAPKPRPGRSEGTPKSDCKSDPMACQH